MDKKRLFNDEWEFTTENAIEHIGNNVSIEFENMDFAPEGFKKLILCGRSHTEKNTIHVRFQGELTNTNQIAEFPYFKDYVTHEFDLTTVPGSQKLTFMFLPGSNFDFKWFQFVK